MVHVTRVHELCLATSALVPSLSVCVGTHTLNGGIGEGKKVVMMRYMVQLPVWGIPSAHIGFVYNRDPDSMDESNFGYRWWVSRQLNGQMCGVRVWVEIRREFPKIS